MEKKGPNRRRHALIPRKITYKAGCDLTGLELERMHETPFSCGIFTSVCCFCGARYFTDECDKRKKEFKCCMNGTVQLPPLRCPLELRRLYTDDTPETTEFLTHVRAINSLFAMASFKTSGPKLKNMGQGHWSFSVCGNVYHFTNGLPNAQDLLEPVLNHYYFLEMEEVTERRQRFMSGRVAPETIRFLELCLRKHNKIIKAYEIIGRVIRAERANSGRDTERMRIGFSRTGRGLGHGLPESRSDVAALFYRMEPPADVNLILYPSLMINERGEMVRRRHEVKNLNPLGDPMVYPLLFPFAEDGYFMELRHNNHKITIREFYRYIIQCREPEFSVVHNAGKLFQQYLVDAWVRVETDYLWFIKQNQAKFKFTAGEIVRRVIAADPSAAGQVGQPVVLPASFLGGPRHMRRLYLDAMTVAMKHGHPDLFVTFTCNPNWPEIKDNLKFRQKFENRPDLVCRVFRIKFLEFMDDVVFKQIYGKVKNYHYVIEFQKRGLPHAHVIITLDEENKIVTEEDVDGIVQAVIPDGQSQPRLFELVSKYQIHSPCGRFNPKAPCMVNGKCEKHFPMKYESTTKLKGGHDRRPLYRRPDNNRSIESNDYVITNGWIVPYNPYALVKYQTHINFEVIGSLGCIRYLYKLLEYVMKGSNIDPDIVVTNPANSGDASKYEIDEVSKYLKHRQVCSMEAAWRLLDFRMHDRSHAVLVLPVHLPGQCNSTCEQTDDVTKLDAPFENSSKLEAWFRLNQSSREARVFRYEEIPDHYTWHYQTCSWRQRRQVNKLLGCIAEVSFKARRSELFYLRVLLRYVAGATSYEYLRTVDGTVHDTFESACKGRGLVADENEYDSCLREAVRMNYPAQLRRLFVLIACNLSGDNVARASSFWQKYKARLIEDFRHRGLGREQSLSLCALNIQALLQWNWSDLTCASLGITLTDDDLDDGVVNEDIVEDDPLVVHERQVFYDPAALNKEQKQIFLRVLKAVAQNSGRVLPVDLGDALGEAGGQDGERLYYIDGPSGTGKTLLCNTLACYVKDVLKLTAISIASSDIAANLLVGGVTAKQCFNFRDTVTPKTAVGWHIKSDKSKIFKRCALIVWDEAAMTPRYALESVDTFLRKVTGAKEKPMGGKCVVFSGDFRQVLPAIPVIGNRDMLLDASLKKFSHWDTFVKLKLRANMRAPIRPERFAELSKRTFAEWLFLLGEGQIPHFASKSLQHLPKDLIEIPKMFQVYSLEELFAFVYGDDLLGGAFEELAILCPTDDVVEVVNDAALKKIEGNVKNYISFDTYKSAPNDAFHVTLDVLNSVSSSELPAHELKLKVGAVVILLRNLNIGMGEYNGTRMRVKYLGDHLIECEMLGGLRPGQRVWIPRIKMSTEASSLPRSLTRLQFPIRLAYAMVINKTRGSTFKRIGVYLKRACSHHGQLYAACSKVGEAGNLRVFIEDGLDHGALKHNNGRKFTRNVVYRTFLED